MGYVITPVLPWWGWLLIAAGLWFAQLMVASIFDDEDHFGLPRLAVIAAMLFALAMSVIRFVKWAWHN